MDVNISVGEDVDFKIDEDLCCRFLGLLILSSKFEMSIEQLYASKSFPAKSFMP